MNRTNKTSDGSHLFQVEINISASSKGAALKQLISVLDNAEITDYRIGSDIETGKAASAAPVASPSAKKAASKAPVQADSLELRIRHFIESNQLIRLSINKGRGVKMSIPCRVINFDPVNQLLTVYHVDEKQVYSLGLNEIDDFVNG
ncbi:hypothetical protein [Cohnella abietis]|uniref:Uncharacterized protein n=1 Tax=Cohnella abietis TaxID=2507935 RepID=A0A3T1D2I5_9BACL|nr:hypothetical protein [Cohnella abietis]BBI32320.1 hypothetical protein KCTCHS21_17190 [Cohnella abietis]